MPYTSLLITVWILCFASAALAQPDETISLGRQRLISSEKILGAQDDVASVPIYFNFDQKVGLAHLGTTQYTQIEPRLPYRINSEYSYIIQPTISYQTFYNYDGYSSSGFNPTIIQSFFTQSDPKNRINSLYFGPMIQIKTNMPSQFGTSQNGAGYSAAAIHRTEDWVIGVMGFQSFGLGAIPTIGVSANNIMLRPFLTYITKKYGNYTLDVESVTNIDNGMHAYPINFMASKLIDIGDTSFLLTAGIRYYSINTIIGGAQGWGGRLGLTYAFSN